ncbi:MAG: AAA family ATPase [Synechococcus sp.]
MPRQDRRTYGDVPKRRVEVLVGALLAYANENLAGELRSFLGKKVDVRSSDERCLVVNASMSALIGLAGRYEERVESGSKGERTFRDRTQVNDALFHLEHTLKVLDDNRIHTNNSPHFTLRLWYPYREKQRNLEEIQKQWPQTSQKPRRLRERTAEDRASSSGWWEQSLQPLSFSAFLSEKRRFFTGREWLFEEIENRFIQSGEQVLLLTGDPGSGKTALAAEFVHRNAGDRVLAYHFCQADNEQTLSPGRFVRSLAGAIAKQLDGYAACLANPAVEEALSEENCETNPAGAFENGLLNCLTSACPGEGDIRYIIIDGLDESVTRFRDSVNRTIAGILTSRLNRIPDWLRVLVTTRCDADVMLRFSRSGMAEIRASDERNLRDIDEYIESRIEGSILSVLLEQSGKTLEFVKATLRQKGNGNILYVQQVLEGIEHRRYSFERLDLLPPGLSGLYLEYFERQFPDRQRFATAKKVLQAIAAAREPLTDVQLATVTHLDLEDELYPVLRELSAYLHEREGADGQRSYTFFHKSLMDWLTGQEVRGSDYYISAKRGNQLIAATLAAEWEDYSPSDRHVWNDYLERYMPYHLIQAEAGEQLTEAIVGRPELFKRGTVETVVNLVLDRDSLSSKVEQFLRCLGSHEDWIATSTLMGIGFDLLECKVDRVAERVVEFCSGSYLNLRSIQLAWGLKQSSLASQPDRLIELSGQLLKEKQLPTELKGMAHYHLAEGLRVSGKHAPAMRSYQSALAHLSQESEFKTWMQSQCALGDLEYVVGKIPAARSRLTELQSIAEEKRDRRFQATILRLFGQVDYITGDFAAARQSFKRSLKLFRQVRRPQKIVEALNSLAQVELYLNADVVPDLLREIRQRGRDCGASLELGKSTIIEAKLSLMNDCAERALELGREAERLLGEVGYGSGMARSRMLISEAALQLGLFDTALESALAASRYFKSERIYPSLRLRAYDLTISAARALGGEADYAGCDRISQIPYLENFPNMRKLIERHDRSRGEGE